MRNSEHPAYHNTARKLGRLCSFLYNFEQPLRDDGFDYDAALKWTGEHMSAIGVDEPGDPALEPEIFQRMEHLVKFLEARVPEHPFLPNYRLYFQLWRECQGEPVRTLTAEDLKPLEEAEEPVIAPTIYGVPFERLDAARLAMGRMEFLHKGFAPLLMFLDGLLYAMGYFERHQQLPVHDYDDGLRAAAREALEDAVDFANEPGTREQVRLHSNPLMPETQQLLFMAIYHTSICNTSAVYEWLHRHSYQRDLTSMLFAMGVRSLNDPYAKNLVYPWISECGHVNEWMPDEGKAQLHDFFNND